MLIQILPGSKTDVDEHGHSIGTSTRAKVHTFLSCRIVKLNGIVLDKHLAHDI